MKLTSLSAAGRVALRNIGLGVVFCVGIALLILWLAGSFAPKIRSARAGPEQREGRPAAGETLIAARIVRMPATESAVGSIRAVHETTVASKLLAKVTEVRVKAGQPVHTDDVLVRLDDADLRARKDQAEATVRAAEATRDQAQIELERVRGLFAQNNAAKIELEQAETAVKSAVAHVEQAQQALREAAVTLDYATILSPLDGIVVDKNVEVGDTVTPGQALLTLYDPTHMQLVASVRESLIRRLKLGQTVGVRVDTLNRTCAGEVSEIVPASDVASRSFLVKVTGPCPPEIHSGMFGRLLIPLDEEQLLVIPRAAVRRIGQLDNVDVADADGTWLTRRVVQLGRPIGDDVEVLTGLRDGERVAVPKAVEAGGEKPKG